MFTGRKPVGSPRLKTFATPPLAVTVLTRADVGRRWAGFTKNRRTGPRCVSNRSHTAVVGSRAFAGKVEMITGVGTAMARTLTQWGNPNRPIAASGVFGHYMVTPADQALFVVNGETRTVNCEIGGLVHPRLVTWVTMQLQ